MESISLNLMKWRKCATLALPMNSNASPKADVTTMVHNCEKPNSESGNIPFT